MRDYAKISCLILLIIFPFVLIYPQTEQYKFRHITSEDGLPSNYTGTIMKDSDGFIWISTNSGLCRYDGYDIKVYQNNPTDSTSLSHNNVKSNIVEDKKGNLWIGTSYGLNKFDPYSEKFTRYTHDPDNSLSISNGGALSLFIDKNEVLWIGSSKGELNKYDPLLDSFTKYHPDPSNRSLTKILVIYEDQTGILWIGTNCGLYQFDKNKKIFKTIEPQPPLPDNFFPEYKVINEDIEGNLWFMTPKVILTYFIETGGSHVFRPILGGERQFNNSVALDLLVESNDRGKTLWIASGGLLKLSLHSYESVRIKHDPSDPKSLIGSSIYKVFRDETGILWISSAYGLNILDKESTQLKEHHDFAEKYNSSATVVLEDNRGHFWVGTGDEGIIHFDNKMNEIHWYNALKSDEDGNNLTGIVKAILEDSEGNIWVGDNKTGLYYLDRESNEFINCKLTDRPIKASFIYDICEDSEGSIWIGTYHGVYRRKSEVSPITNFSFLPITDPPMRNYVRRIFNDSAGNIWICTNGKGLFCQTPGLKEKDRFIHYTHDPKDDNSLSSNGIVSAYEDNQNRMWFASRHGLNRFIKESNNFERIFFDLNEASNFIGDITGDKQENLWLSTQNGLLRFSISSKNDTTDNYLIKQFMPFKDIYLQRISRSKDGKIIVGSPTLSGLGFTSFYPDSIEDNKNIPPVVITKFFIRNNPAQIDSSITMKKHILLNYNDNFFSFEFSSLDYTNPDKNQYAYYLKGLEEEWIYSNNRRLANYTGVPPGKYIFKVKGSNNDGYWNETGTSICITILPPPWKTWWAYCLYILFIFSVLYFIIRLYLRRHRLLHKLELEQIQTEKLEELDKLKSRFFANISHEFRTPLTLILGPLEKLRSKITDKESGQDLNMMQRNAQRLQKLINQLLSLAKLESDQMKLQTQEQNIVALVNWYVQSFESLAKQKEIDLIFKSDEKNIQLYVDKDKIEKILFNLISNAFKFTGEGGRIQVTVDSQQLAVGKNKDDQTANCELRTADSEGLCVMIQISDTGRGIPPEKLEHIFDRFYQADDSYTKDQEGSGIGLALTKELVEKHYGQITVKSKVGKGTTLNVYLPMGKVHLKPEEIVNSVEPDDIEKPVDHIIQLNELESKEILFDDDAQEDTRPLLLIVEDNEDLRSYIRSFLYKDYSISEAVNGKLGLKKAIEKVPDLLISDVMMPEMDGYKLCEKLKTDERTSHIPIILLTARASMESKIEGLETGADDFITKPFDPIELQTRIRNLILQRKKLQDRFMKKIRKIGLEHLIEIETEDMTSMDQKFIQRVIQIIQKYLSDPDFDVEMLSSAMVLSRMQVHRKLMGLTGYTPGSFIRHMRLNKAAELLKNQTGTVSEIAFEVGFNNLSYFSKCFKEQFDVLPSEINTTKSNS